MANLTNNRINTQITHDDIAEIIILLGTIKDKIPEIGLTPKEYKSFRGIDVQKKVFVENTIKMLRLNGDEIMPSYIKPLDVIADFELFESLDKIKSLLDSLTSRVNATQRIVGKEALDVSLAAYKHYALASSAGVPNAHASYTKLSEHFEKQKGRKPDAAVKKTKK